MGKRFTSSTYQMIDGRWGFVVFENGEPVYTGGNETTRAAAQNLARKAVYDERRAASTV